MKKNTWIIFVVILTLMGTASLYLFQKNRSNKEQISELSDQVYVLQSEKESLTMELEEMGGKTTDIFKSLWEATSMPPEEKYFETKRVDEETLLLFRYDTFYEGILEKFQVIYSDGSYVDISEVGISTPQLSPNKEEFAYIAEYGWEIMGDLYIYDFVGKESKKYRIEDIHPQTCPTGLMWLDDTYLLVITNSPYGITLGGNIYAINLKDGSSSMIIEAKALPDDPSVGDVQIYNMEIEEDMITLYSKFFDENMDLLEDAPSWSISREDIEELISTETTKIIEY